MGEAADDEVRATLFHQLMDWEGTEQVGCLFTLFIVVVCTYLAWKRFKRWRGEAKEQLIEYKVIKPPSRLAAEGEGGKKKKRVCAVMGGTGFIGSEIVNELVRRDEYLVYALDRTFHPKRTNPDADCLIQVDLRDPVGLAKAFQGVDSVINAAAIIPSIFSKPDNIRRMNKTSFNNILRAAKEAGVKNLVHLSGIATEKMKDPGMRAFMTTLMESKEVMTKANGTNGLSTCVVAPANVIGLNCGYFDGLLSGQQTEMPMSDKMPVSFMPVEYLARAMVNAEAKLAEGDKRIAGRSFPLRGELMSWKTFFELPSWPNKIKPSSKLMLSIIIKVNTFCARVVGWAPFGAEIDGAVMEIFDVTESGEVDPEKVAEAYDLLGVGPPAPPMEEYITEMVKKYQATQESQKDK